MLLYPQKSFVRVICQYRRREDDRVILNINREIGGNWRVSKLWSLEKQPQHPENV